VGDFGEGEQPGEYGTRKTVNASSRCFSTVVQDLLLKTRVRNIQERCPPRQMSSVKRLKAIVEPVLTELTVEF
jgi:hypothetical protein